MTIVDLDKYVLDTCNFCNGTKVRTEYEILKGKVKAKDEVCSYCNGTGKLLNKRDNIQHKIVLTKRDIEYRENILSGKYPIPYEFYYNSDIQQVLNTNPYANADLLVLQMVENRLLEFKESLVAYEYILENNIYNCDRYKKYNTAIIRPCDHICVRCSYFLDGTDSYGEDSCNRCCNENGGVNDNIYSKFSPIHEEAKQWYNNGGYELNMNYDKNHNYMIQ